MAEDREDGSPGDEAEQFEVLDLVGEVEGWDGDFQDDDEQDVEDEDEQVGKAEDAADEENKEQSETSLNKESSPNKDVNSEQFMSKEVQSASKDVKSKESSSSKHETSGKDGKSINDTKHTHKDVSSNNSGKQRGSESQRKSTGSAVKRKSDNRGAQKPDAKKIKLSSGNEVNKRRPSEKEIEVISTDSCKEHQLSKKNFVDAMINLSDEMKLARDYRRWVEKERKDGMLFPVFDIDESAEPILFNCCQLVSGYETDSTKLCLGFARNEEVLRFSASEEKYVPGVRSTVKAFEEMVRSSSKPLFDPITRQGYWHGVTVITNSRGNTLLRVNLYADDEDEGEVRFAEAKDILDKYFSSKAALDCQISSMYLRLVFAKKKLSTEKVATERMAARCIMGNKFIVETISGTNVNLYPWSFFSTGTVAMTALCEQMLKLLLQERCKTVLELGCGTGIVGQFLAKHCTSVLGVDTAGCIAEAKVNADENHLSNCTYFDKNMVDIWKTLNDELRGKSSVMVIVNALNYDFLVEYPAISWLIRSDKVSRVVYVKMTKTKAKTPKLRVTFLCTPTRQLKKHHDDPMPYFPLYALPVNLGAEFFAAVLVLQHVENNFINELYERRQKYTGKCMRIANSSGLHREEDDPREEAKHRSTSSAAKKNVAGNKSLSGGRGPARRGVDTGSTRASRMVELGRGVDTDRTRDSRRVELARGVDTGRTRASRRVELGRGMDTERTRASRQELAGSRNVRGNKDGMLATHIAASRHDATLPPRDMRNVLQSRPGHNHIGNLLDKLISPSEIQDLITVLQGKRMYAERHVGVANDFREKRFVDEIIHDRNRNRLGSIFVRGVVPPGTEDRRQVLQPGRGQVLQPGRGQVRVYNNNDLRSFIDENRATHNNEGKDSFRESSRLPRDAETWVGARMRVSLRDDLSSGRNLYPPDVRGKLHSRNNEPEAFPLVKDSALFERGLGSKTNIRDERRKLFSDIQGMRSINADLRGSGPGRSFDDADLGRRKPRTDDIASGIKTDVRGVNIRAGGWKARDDIRNMESIRDSFSKFDAYLSNVKSSMDFQHSGKAKPEFNQFFPNAGPKSERRSLFPNSKPQVTGDIRGENPYRDDKPNYFGEGDKSSKAGWFAFNERRAEDGIADRNRTHVDGSERNRIVGESVRGRRIFGGPERTGASVGPVDRNRNVFVRAEDRKRQVFETEARNKQVFIEPNRNSLLFGGSEDRKKPLYDVEDRNRSVYGELENRKRQMYVSPDDRKRYGEPVDSKRLKYGELLDKRSVYEEPGDRKRSVYGGPEDGSGYMFRKTDSRNLPVTKRSRPVVEVGRNRPTVEEIERSRLMAGEREREKVLFGGMYRYK